MNAKAGRSLVFARDDGMGALSILSTHLRLFVVFKLHKHIYIYIYSRSLPLNSLLFFSQDKLH